jgi:pimeloyl-ACP methyl ester carboxylesterase
VERGTFEISSIRSRLKQTQQTAHPLRLALRLLLIALLVYGAACVVLYAFQRSLLYFPQPGASGGTGTFVMAAGGADLRVAYRPHAGPKALLYFGGNAEDVSASLPLLASALPDYAIYALHYRGYGGSSGKPSEAMLHADALALFDRVRTGHPEVALMGRSLGSGVAVRLASRRPASRVVLVTPYDSILEIATRQLPYFPVRWLLTDKFESWRDAPAIRVPTLLLRAEFDEVIPSASTERLNAAFAPGVASLITIHGASHNTIANSTRYAEAIRKIL